MICKLYNKMQKYNESILGISADEESEINLLMFIMMIFFTIFYTVVFAWWIIPLKRIKFRCDNR